MARLDELLATTPSSDTYNSYIDELTSLVIYEPQTLTKRSILLFIRKFPEFYFCLSSNILKRYYIARRIIVASRGRVFANLPECIRSNVRLAALAWRLNPIIGYAIDFKLRRVVATETMVLHLVSFATDHLTGYSLKYIPRAAMRQFARKSLAAREAFYVFLHCSPVTGVLNQLIASFIPIQVERIPTYAWGKKIHWINRLKRYAV